MTTADEGQMFSKQMMISCKCRRAGVPAQPSALNDLGIVLDRVGLYCVRQFLMSVNGKSGLMKSNLGIIISRHLR